MDTQCMGLERATGLNAGCPVVRPSEGKNILKETIPGTPQRDEVVRKSPAPRTDSRDYRRRRWLFSSGTNP
jgi:predicted RNA-binding protein with PUA domain